MFDCYLEFTEVVADTLFEKDFPQDIPQLETLLTSIEAGAFTLAT